MRKLRLPGLLGVCASILAAAPCVPGSLQDYIDLGSARCTIGPSLFYDDLALGPDLRPGGTSTSAGRSIAGKWMHLFRAVDTCGQTVDFFLSASRDREAAKSFLKRALCHPDNRPPQVFAGDGLRSYPAAIRELQADGQLRPRCRHRTRRYSNNRIESDHRHVKRRLRAMQGPRTEATAWAVIQGIEAAQMVRKGQVLGIGQFTSSVTIQVPCRRCNTPLRLDRPL